MIEKTEKKTLRERIENHLGLVIAGFVVGGFIAGFSAYSVIRAITDSPDQSSDDSWQESARRQGWVPSSECPAYPISLAISSPGDKTVIDVSTFENNSFLKADLVIRSSYTIAQAMDVGVVFNEEGSGNYYVAFPLLNTDDNRRIFRSSYTSEGFHAPFVLSRKTPINMWALAVADQASIGSLYGGLQQIQDSDETVVLSPKISIYPKGNDETMGTPNPGAAPDD